MESKELKVLPKRSQTCLIRVNNINIKDDKLVEVNKSKASSLLKELLNGSLQTT